MKTLKELNLKEHTDLKNYRILKILFPDATGDFREDCEAAESSDSKCEWIAEQIWNEPSAWSFKGCEKLQDSCQHGLILGSNSQTKWVKDYKLFICKDAQSKYIEFCPYCGADIRRPEQP